MIAALVQGHSVYPSEVEEVLYQHPAISQAAVRGCNVGGKRGGQWGQPKKK